MDGLLPPDLGKRQPITGTIRRKRYKILVDVEMKVKRAVTLEFKHNDRVIGGYTSASL